jgi:hypothetical protein
MDTPAAAALLLPHGGVLPEWAYGPLQYAAAVVGGPASIERSTTLRTEFKKAASRGDRRTGGGRSLLPSLLSPL